MSPYRLEASNKERLDRELFSRPGSGSLHAWRAINFFLGKGEPLPAWVNEYLLETSEKLLEITKPKKNAPQLVFKAIGITGKEFTPTPNHAPLFYQVEGPRADEGLSSEAAYRRHARATGMSKRTVKRYHLEEKKEFKKLVPGNMKRNIAAFREFARKYREQQRWMDRIRAKKQGAEKS